MSTLPGAEIWSGTYHQAEAKAITDQFRSALASKHRLEDLRRAAEHELQAGVPREEIVAKLEALRSGLSDSDDDVGARCL